MTAPYSTRSHSTRSLKKNIWEWVEMVITHHIPLPFSVAPGTGGNGWERMGMGEPSRSQKQLMKNSLSGARVLALTCKTRSFIQDQVRQRVYLSWHVERKAKPTACAVRVPAIVLEMQPRLVHLCLALHGSSECIQSEKLKHLSGNRQHARGKSRTDK